MLVVPVNDYAIALMITYAIYLILKQSMSYNPGMSDIDSAITEVVEEAVGEAVEDAAEEVEEAANDVEEAAEEVTEEVDGESPKDVLETVNEALAFDERIRAIAKEEAQQCMDMHVATMPHGETIVQEIIMEAPTPEVEEAPTEDEPPRIEHPWFRERGRSE